MTDDNGRRARRVGIKVALIGVGIAGGVVLGTAISAGATTTSGTGTGSSSGSPSSTAPQNGPASNGKSLDHGGASPVRSDEKSVSSALAAKLKAAALGAVPGGSVYRVETDAGDGTYEAHMTKADGSLVTVKFDKSGNVTKVETGMGTGDPAPRR